MSKKLLFLTHVGNPGGAEYNMIDYCTVDTYEAHVTYFQNGKLEEVLNQKNINHSLITMPEKMKDFSKSDGILNILKAIIPSVSMIKSLNKKCTEYDVIICMSQKSFILASLAKPFNKKPIIWFMNDILSKKDFSSALLFTLKFISKLSANHIILNSQASLKAWKKVGAKTENVSIIYPGVDISKFDSALLDKEKIAQFKKIYSANKAPLVGIFGRITSWKGQDIFLKAIDKIKNINGVIVGDALFGEENFKESLHAMTQDLGLENRVTFAGHCDDVPRLMAACDIIVHCSTSPEPYGLVISEACTVKTPIIASNAGGAKEIIIHDETGQLTPTGDVEALVTAIEKYISDPIWAKKLANNGRKRIEDNYSKTIMTHKFEKILDRI